MGLLKEVREFAVKGNAVDMAVGIVIGAAFGKIVDSLVKDIIMPPIGILLGKVDFSNLFVVLLDGKTAGPYATLDAAKAAGAVTLNLGVFFNVLISFVIVSFAVFILIKGLNTLRRTVETPAASAGPVTKECPFCFTTISIKAVRCPNCTSQL